MNKSPLISIIVPVYNVERYLEECLTSLLNQTYSNIEVICVDDGSTDLSGEILKKYSRLDSRILVITQTNAGLSSARNAALKVASGEWVTGVDSDDYLIPETLERCIPYLADSDIDVLRFVFEDFCDDNPAEILNSPWLKPPFDGKYKVSEDIILKQNLCFCGKIWRLSLIREHHLEFPEGILYEDQCFWYNAMPYCRSIYFLNDNRTAYRYRRRSGSIMGSTSSATSAKVLQLFKVVELNIEYYLRNGVRQLLGYASDVPSRTEISMLELSYRNVLRWCPSSHLDEAWILLRRIVDKYNYLPELKKYPWLQTQYTMPKEVQLIVERLINKKEGSLCELLEIQGQLSKVQKELQNCMCISSEQRLLELSLMLPMIRCQCWLLKIKKIFSWGERRRKYKEKIRELRNLLREYRYEASKRCDNR